MSNNTISAILVITLVVVIFAGLLIGWRRRTRRQAGFAELAALPAELGATLGEFEGLYLATTPAGEPLNRIVVRGLGFRARTTLHLTEAGVVFIADRFIPRSSVTGIGRATWTIDRSVESNGLSVVSWMLGDEAVDSYFRLDDPEGFVEVGTEFMKKAEK